MKEALPTPTLLLFPSSPYDPRLEALQRRLRREAGSPPEAVVDPGDLALGAFGSDPGAWRQAGAFTRASLWFLLGRQALAERDDPLALTAFQHTRAALEEGGLLVRGPLLSSVALITGRLLMKGNELGAADEAFRTAVLVDPGDVSDQLLEGPERTRYQLARQFVLESPRLPVRIEADSEGAVLYVNGTRVHGEGTTWLVELPAGRHMVSAEKAEARTASAGFRLQLGETRQVVRLRLEPGLGCGPCQRPFSLAEATALQEKLRSLVESRGSGEVLVAVVVGPVAGKQPGRPGPKVGIQEGVRLNPGPDAADDAPPPGPVEVEFFRLDSSGRISFMGSREVGPNG